MVQRNVSLVKKIRGSFQIRTNAWFMVAFLNLLIYVTNFVVREKAFNVQYEKVNRSDSLTNAAIFVQSKKISSRVNDTNKKLFHICKTPF